MKTNSTSQNSPIRIVLTGLVCLSLALNFIPPWTPAAGFIIYMLVKNVGAASLPSSDQPLPRRNSILKRYKGGFRQFPQAYIGELNAKNGRLGRMI